MLKVSGPVSVSIFQLSKGKKIFCFGDIHETKSGLCKPLKKGKPFYITDFIDTLPLPTDVFIESSWILDEDKDKVELKNETNVLSSVQNHYKDMMYYKQRRKDGFRVHFTDIRDVGGLLHLYLIFDAVASSWIDEYITYIGKHPIEDILLYFPAFENVKKYFDIIINSDDNEHDMRILMNGDNIYIGSDVLVSAPGKKDRKIHRIRKQLLKLSIQNRKKLLAYHKIISNEFEAKYKSTYDTIISKLRDLKDFSKCKEKDLLNVMFVVFVFSAHMMDMYTLARMINFLQKPKSKNFVFYAGAAHTKNYKRFFENFWLSNAILVFNQDVKEYKNGNIKRCVAIPKTLLH